MSTTFVHPWYLQQQEQESTTTAESELTLKHPQEKLGETLTDFEEFAWAAGIFEGEGCLAKKATGWMLQVRMTDVDVIDHIASVWDVTYRMETKKAKPHYKPTAVIQISKRDTIFEIVSEMYPYLGARRREKCNEFLQWYAAKTGKRYD